MTKHRPDPWWFSAAEEGYYVAGVGDKELTNLIQKEDARLIASAPELLDALRAYQAAQKMPRYGDYQDFVWPQSKMRHEGEPAYGWVCEKHGLGYQSGCICCYKDFRRHQDQKDQDARYARDDALRAADEIAQSAIAKATGETE